MRTWAALAGLALAAPAAGDSAFELPYPAERGSVPASTYWVDGQPAGDARVEVEIGTEQQVHMRFEAGDPMGARMQASAWLVPVSGGGALRLARQQSSSFGADGESRGGLEVDHSARRARCFDPQGELVEEIELDERDRIVNAALGIVLQSLVPGPQERLRFQLLLCRAGARLIDFDAWTEQATDGAVQVRYGPDYGIVSPIARRFVTPMAFWFDAHAPHAWRGHRFPLFTGGPEVMVLREGLPVGALR